MNGRSLPAVRAARALGALGALTLGLALPLACKRAETAGPVTTKDGGVAAAPMSATESAPAAVRITTVDLGKALGPDRKVQAPLETFAPKDTIFASVTTDGAAPSATLYAKWTYQDGRTVKSDSRTIAPKGPAVTEFSIQKPDGWPKGGYKIDVSVGSAGSAVSKSFRVE